MQEILEKIEATGIATWVRESPSIFAYTTVLALHAMGLAIVAGLNTVVALRLLGAVKVLPLASLRGLFPAMWAGFWINVFSGVLLLMANATGMLALPIFYSKMGFIVLGAINLRMMQKRVFTNDAMLATNVADRRARRHAWLTILFWGGALVCGRLTAYPGLLSNLLGL
jgi:hypothetical protein